MWKKIAPMLVVLSLALNAAFIGVWGVHAVRAHWSAERPEDGGAVGCPLHRRLNVTDEQWRQIEPRLAAFRRDSQSRRREIGRLRGEMIDLIAAERPDRQAMAAKHEEIRAGQRQMQQMVIEHLLAEKEVLTAEQEKELFEMLRRRSACPGPGRMMGFSATADDRGSTQHPGRKQTNPAPDQE